MSLFKPSIPAVDDIADQRVREILVALKGCLEFVIGRRGGTIAHLGPTPTTAAIVNKINEVIDRLQG